MNQNQTKNRYFVWLCDWMDCRTQGPGYEKILELLFNLEFYSLIPYDDNRIIDGLQLRYRYISDFPNEKKHVGKCSVLEMLIALGDRMGYILYDPDVDALTKHREVFWELISNLGLKPQNGIRSNQVKVITFLERDYTRKGKGGLFPLKTSKRDQRKVEIWYQMQEYIAEKVSHL